MPNEELERFIQDAPKFIVEAVLNIIGFIYSMDFVEIDELLVPVIYKDFPEMFRCAVVFMMIAYVVSMHIVAPAFMDAVHGVIINREGICTRVCKWLSITFFILAISIFIICALLGFRA